MYHELRVPAVGTLWWAQADQPASSSGGDAGEEAPGRIIAADGSADLILRDDALLVAGPSTRALRAEGSRTGVTVGVRFDPGAAGLALSQSAGPLRDAQLAGTAVLSPSQQRSALSLLRRVRDAVAGAEQTGDETTRLAREGETRAAHAAASAVWCAYAPALADQRHWRTAVRNAAANGAPMVAAAGELGLSERHFRRRMTEEFGYGFTSLRRVLRAERAHELLRGGVPAAEVAARGGYADQAHLTRELRDISGTTPGRVARYAAGSGA